MTWRVVRRSDGLVIALCPTKAAAFREHARLAEPDDFDVLDLGLT